MSLDFAANSTNKTIPIDDPNIKILAVNEESQTTSPVMIDASSIDKVDVDVSTKKDFDFFKNNQSNQSVELVINKIIANLNNFDLITVKSGKGYPIFIYQNYPNRYIGIELGNNYIRFNDQISESDISKDQVNTNDWDTFYYLPKGFQIKTESDPDEITYLTNKGEYSTIPNYSDLIKLLNYPRYNNVITNLISRGTGAPEESIGNDGSGTADADAYKPGNYYVIRPDEVVKILKIDSPINSSTSRLNRTDIMIFNASGDDIIFHQLIIKYGFDYIEVFGNNDYWNNPSPDGPVTITNFEFNKRTKSITLPNNRILYIDNAMSGTGGSHLNNPDGSPALSLSIGLMWII